MKKNEVLLISKYAPDFIQFADNYDNLSQQEKDEYINSCLDKSIVDLMKLSNEFAASNFGRYCKYEQTNLYKYLTNTFCEEAFDEKEKSFLLNNSQVIREKVYNNLKIMVPTKDDLNKFFLNNFQRMLYGTHEYIDKNNRMKSISTYNEELSSINENLFYVYIDDSSNLRLVVAGELNENHDYRLIYKANIRPMIRLCINDLIKNYSNNNNKIVKHIINNKENEKVSNFIKEKRIKLDGTYELYKEPIFNVYTELKDYINHNRSTGKKYGTFGYDYYEIKWDNDKQTIELSYKLVDMDNDGCKELVIFNNDRLLELYTIYKNTLRHLYSSVRGSTLGHSYKNYITEDNKLLTHY